MALFLSERDVRELLRMEEALEAVEEVFRAQGQGRTDNRPRQRVRSGRLVLHTMSGSVPEMGWIGCKVYTSGPQGARFLVLLYDGKTGALEGVLEADWLGCMRTGAASGIATRYLALEHASTVGMFGAGHQAETQLWAVASVRTLREAVVYARRPDRLQAFCERMSRKLNLPVRPAEDPKEAARQDIVITITHARDPVLEGAWLQPGVHVNAAGSNVWMKREIDDETVQRAAVIATDDLEQAHIEAGDLLAPIERGRRFWSAVIPLGQIVAGHHPGRRDASEVTLYSSQGIAILDVAVAGRVLQKARELGRGQEIPLFASLSAEDS